MDSRILLLSVAIGLLHLAKIVSTVENTNNSGDPAMEILFRTRFADEDIAFMSENENDNGLSDVLIDAVGDVPIISPKQCVSFHLFTRSNPSDAYHMEVDDVDNLKRSPFNSALQTKIIIHGWMNRVTEPWITNMRENYLRTSNCNVIVVNWDLLSMNAYVVSTHITRLVGQRTGEFLKFLNIAANMSFKRVHMIGHSLGAHVAGFAGATVSGAVSRITGLDPAGPLFEVPILKNPRSRLDASDALFVDIIHTCSGAAAFRRAIGHVDFYPNGGSFPQPGCPSTLPLSCSHSRAYEYMVDSIIYPDEFVAVQCDNWDDYQEEKCLDHSTAIMGELASSDSRGTFYLETNAESPYGKSKTT